MPGLVSLLSGGYATVQNSNKALTQYGVNTGMHIGLKRGTGLAWSAKHSRVAHAAGMRNVTTHARAPIRDQNVAVIGSSRGIGLEFVRQLLERGNKVHATARDPEGSQGLQKLKNHQNLVTSSLDTSDPGGIRSWAASLKGEPQFKYVITAAGATDWERSDIHKISSETMLQLFQVNSIGPLLLAQQLLEQGLIGDGSTLVNLTSKMGSVTDNGSGGSYAYRASKAALNQITKSLSVDLEPLGITACVLHPGWVRTDMTSNRGLIDVDECVSGLLSVLESDKPLGGHWWDYKHDEIGW